MLPAKYKKGNNMRFLVSFPADHRNLIVINMTINSIYNDAILTPFARDIERFRIGEYMIIRNSYLVVRIQ